MTEYWKSNERRFCDSCNCWISDNKASISFHENGKRHKMNVALRISEISRNKEKSDRERLKMEADIRKMEEAAMFSYARDIHSRADMTARSIHAVMEATSTKNSTATVSPGNTLANSARPTGTLTNGRTRQIDPMRLPDNCDDEDDGARVRVQKIAPEEVPNPSLWVEGKSDEGYTYYWNVKTNESVWEAPKEGYLSYQEYERINEIALQQQSMQEAADAKKFRDNVNEEVAKYNREKLKRFRRNDNSSDKIPKAEDDNRPTFKTQEEAATTEIGLWQTVEVKPPPPPLDLGLPKLNEKYFVVPATELKPEIPVKVFKEKTITSLGDDADVKSIPTTFKKRKFAAKSNARKRFDDD